MYLISSGLQNRQLHLDNREVRKNKPKS